MRRKKKDLDKLVDFVVDGAVDEFIEEMAAEDAVSMRVLNEGERLWQMK